MRLSNTPVLSTIGLLLFAITLTVNVSFKHAIRYANTSEGIAMLLSVANAVLLLFTLLWGVIAVMELMVFIRSYNSLRERTDSGRIGHAEYRKQARRLKVCFAANAGYLSVFTCQLAYVLLNWNEINV